MVVQLPLPSAVLLMKTVAPLPAVSTLPALLTRIWPTRAVRLLAGSVTWVGAWRNQWPSAVLGSKPLSLAAPQSRPSAERFR